MDEEEKADEEAGLEQAEVQKSCEDEEEEEEEEEVEEEEDDEEEAKTNLEATGVGKEKERGRAADKSPSGKVDNEGVDEDDAEVQTSQPIFTPRAAAEEGGIEAVEEESAEVADEDVGSKEAGAIEFELQMEINESTEATNASPLLTLGAEEGELLLVIPPSDCCCFDVSTVDLPSTCIRS